MPRSSRPLPASLMVFAWIIAGVVAAEEPSEEALKAKGLRKVNSTYVLAEEAEVQKKLTEARALYRQMTTALVQQQAYDQGLRENRQVIRALTEERIGLNQQLSQVSSATQNNQLVAMINSVTDRLNLLQQQQADPESKRQLDAQVARRREAYVESILNLRQLVDSTTDAYDARASDPAVKEALDQINKRSKIQALLGPSRTFLTNVAVLAKAETSVLSESVDLRKEGGIFWVEVTFNGKLTRPMAFDTGAADVVLPADLAAEIGLRPGKDDPIVRCRIADGSIVEARQMTVPSMRVGKFTVKDVSCTIMPADKKEVPPLLGQTFQRNFLLKFSPDSGKLVLSRVETPEASAVPGKGKAPVKAGARPSTSR